LCAKHYFTTIGLPQKLFQIMLGHFLGDVQATSEGSNTRIVY